MKIHDLLQQSYETFLTEAQTSRLLLLHPESRLRSMLVAKLMNSDAFDAFYYAIGPDDVNLQSFLNSISGALAYQHVTFGRHTNILPRHMLDDPIAHFDTVLEAFVQDISELSDRDFIFILDEYDLSDRADEVQRFVERLSNSFPANGRLVINSRTLPRLPWLSLIAQNRATFLKDDFVITEKFYGTGNHDRDGDGTLQVYTIGPGFVVVNGTFIDTWEGHLPRLLFFFTLDRPIVTRSEICDAFWPELEPDQAVNVFHVTKRRLHKALEADVLVHDEGYYSVNPELSVYYDAVEFADTLVIARRNDDEEIKMTNWLRASELYRGPFLKGHTDRWIVERRDEFRDGYIEALVGMAGIWHNRNNHELALSYLQKAIEANPYREDVHREIIQLLTSVGRKGEAAAHFKRVTTRFKEEKRDLSAQIEAFYQEAMQS